MARQTRRSEEWPTILWIFWIADKNEYEEPLCKNHRKYVFEYYPESARGRGRKGDQCSMCMARPEATPFQGQEVLLKGSMATLELGSL